MIAVQTKRLCKSYGSFRALTDLSIEIKQGETFTLLGANGAGKSTTVNLLTTLLKPTSGTASVFGKDILRDTKSVRRMISLMPQGYALDPFLTVFDNLRFFAKLEGLDKNTWKGLAEQVLAELDLLEKRNTSIMTLSGGQFRRVQLARTLLSDKPLIFIDEPTLGIDVVGKFKIWDIIKKFGRQNGWTLVLCTNDMAEAEYLSDRIMFLQKGSVIRIGTPDELKNRVSGKHLKVKYNQPLGQHLKKLNGYPVIKQNHDNILIYIEDAHTDLRPLLRKAGELGEIADINIEKPSLVDAFRSMQEEAS